MPWSLDKGCKVSKEDRTWICSLAMNVSIVFLCSQPNNPFVDNIPVANPTHGFRKRFLSEFGREAWTLFNYRIRSSKCYTRYRNKWRRRRHSRIHLKISTAYETFYATRQLFLLKRDGFYSHYYSALKYMQYLLFLALITKTIWSFEQFYRASIVHLAN